MVLCIFAPMVNCIYRYTSRRVILFSVSILLLTLALPSCISISKYRQARADLNDSRSKLSDLEAKNSILEADTADYGSRMRGLQQDLNYVQTLNRSENEKDNKEKDRQQEQIKKLQRQLDESEKERGQLKTEMNQRKAWAQGLYNQLKDTLKAYLDTGRATLTNEGAGIRITLNDARWFQKDAPYLTQDCYNFLKHVLRTTYADSSIVYAIERTGPEPGRKNRELIWGSPIMNKSYFLRTWFAENGDLGYDKVQIISLFNPRMGDKESYSIVLTRR